MKYKVTMICREIWRAETVVETDDANMEKVKDVAWAEFDKICKKGLEQENYTKVEEWKNREDSNYEAIKFRDSKPRGSNITPKKKKKK